ncbi:MAG: immunoglobulin domain-containing protein [Ignavibacteriae bacterium]|nr:immunoglobulin domain-containing protein [Ignavibacteriota bacterium]
MCIKKQNKIKNKVLNLKYIMILSALVFWFSISLYSNQDGIAGKTSTTSSGCDCHSNNASSATTVTNTSGSGSYVFTPGSVNSFTVTVAHSSKPKMGIDIAVKTTQTGNTTAGTLSPGSALKTIGGELIHISPITMSGGQATVNFTLTAPSTPGTYYLRAIGNAVNNDGSEDPGDIWNWMTVQALTVSAPGGSITVSAPNGGESWCSGTQHNVTWTSSGVTTVKIELSTDGGSTFSSLATGVTASAGTWAWNIPSGQSAGSLYKVKITDEANATVNDVSNANFSIATGLSISAQPQPVTVCLGSSAQFSVTASGNGLTYQWRKSGANISGANASTYNIASVAAGDAGSYDCVLNSSCGTPVTSNPATLTVNVSPTISVQPLSQAVCQNGNVNFTVTALGSNLTYQWKKDGTNINGATASTYSLTNVQAADAGQYTVEVSGTCTPPVTSQAAVLSLKELPSITGHPQSQIVCQNLPVSFNVTATGTNITYQWKKNGSNINGATAASYSIPSAQPVDAGQYTVEVSGDCTPPATSQAATLTIKNSPAIATQPNAVSVCTGQPASFQVVATGDSLTYKWYKNDVEIPNSNFSSYTIGSAAVNDAGNYKVVVNNSCNTPVTSNIVQLTVNEAPVIVNQPLPLNVTVGANATFTVTANSATSYQWRKNTVDISGQTAASLSINNVQLADSGNYDCKVINDCGNVISQAVKLSVQAAGPGPLMTVSTNNVNFGKIIVNNDKDSLLTSMITNTGSEKLDVNLISVSGSDSSEFTIVGNPVPFSLMPNDSKNINLRFSPVSGGLKVATLKFASNSKQDNNVYLTGFGGIISVSASKTTLNFDTTGTNTTVTNNFTLNNTGNMDADVMSMEINGSNSSFFKINTQTGSFKIDSGGSKEIVVEFNPMMPLMCAATLDIKVQNQSNDIQIQLNGVGIILGVDDNDFSNDGFKSYPNPSGNTVNFEFNIQNETGIEVGIYDLIGNVVKSFDRQLFTNGIKTLSWDGTDNNGNKCGTGAYVCVVKTKNWIKTIQIDLIK